MGNYRSTVLEVACCGRTVRGSFFEPQGIASYPVLICNHGYNGSGIWFHRLAEYMACRGIGTACFDFCGGSVNSRSDMSTVDMTLETEKEDLLAVVKEFRERTATDRIFILGESQGGMVATMAAAEIAQTVAGMILVYPAFCIPDDWNKTFPKEEDIPEVNEFWGMKLGKGFFLGLRELDVYGVMDILGMRTLILHGDKDPVVPLEYSERAVSIMPNAVLRVFAGEGHGFSEAGYERMTEEVYAFITDGTGQE